MKRILIALLIAQSCFVSAVKEEKTGRIAGFFNNFIGKKGLEKAEDMLKDELPKALGDAGEEFGKRTVQGASDELKNQAYKGKEWVAAGALALLASPFAKVIIVAGGVAITAGAACGIKAKYEERGFKRCLNTHFAGELNERGTPRACEAAEANYSSWDIYGHERMVAEFRGQRRLAQKIVQ
jgi:hypothetical protein